MALQTTGKDSFPDITESFGQNTTLHGVRRVLDPTYHKIQKLLWLTLVASGLAVYTVFTYQSIAIYLNYDSVTKISTTTTDSFEFPAVTICDSNTVSRSSMQPYHIGVAPCMFKGLMQHGISTNDTCAEILRNVPMVDLLLPKQRQSLDNIFIKCSFNQEVIRCSDYFTPLIIENSGCYTFMSSLLVNKMGSLTEKAAGYNYGLNILLDTRVDDYLFSYKDGQGMNVLVHDPMHFPSIDEEAFALHPGIEAYVGIKKSVRKTLSVPYSEVPCQKEAQWDYKSDFLPIYGFTEYSYGGCRFDCLYQFGIKSCNCNLGTGENECNLLTFMNCVRDKLNYYYDSHFSASCSCLKPCTQTKYNYQISTLLYPTAFTVEKLKTINVTHRSYDDLRKNLISLFVYFQSMEYDTIEQVPSKTRGDIIADIGGQLGLFLGASLITLFEILEYLCLIIAKKCFLRSKITPVQKFSEDEKEHSECKNTDMQDLTIVHI